MKAVIPAAGLGPRFLPLTEEQPKEMPPVDRPAIHWVVEEAIAAGVTDLLIITGREERASRTSSSSRRVRSARGVTRRASAM